MQQPWRRTNRPLIGYGILEIDHAKDQSQILWPTGLSGLTVRPPKINIEPEASDDVQIPAGKTKIPGEPVVHLPAG